MEKYFNDLQKLNATVESAYKQHQMKSKKIAYT